MKMIRNLLLIFAVVAAMIMQTELFQNQLGNYEGTYQLVSKYEVSEEEKEHFLEEVQTAANKYQVSVFTTDMRVSSDYQRTLHIYGNSCEIREELYDTMKLEETAYISFMQGITAIEFHDFKELKDIQRFGVEFISYIGEEDDIKKVYEELAKTYELTSPTYWQSKETDMIVIVWGLVAIFMISLNGLEAIRRKKEVVVRHSLGEGPKYIFAKSVLLDLISYIIVFLVAKMVVNQFGNGYYEANFVFLIYSIGAVLSWLPYLLFFKFDVREAFANIADEKAVRYLLYGLKVLAFAATVFTITTNLSSIDTSFFFQQNIFKNYSSATYFTIRTDRTNGIEENKETENIFWKELYENEFEIIKPAICTNLMEDTYDFIFVNQYAEDMLQGFQDLLENTSKEADMVVFLPKSCGDGEQEFAVELIGGLFETPINQMNIQYETYDKTQSFVYPDHNYAGKTQKSKNPILIYQNNSYLNMNEERLIAYTMNSIIYQCNREELEEKIEEYASVLGKYRAVYTNVQEAYDYNQNFMMNLIRFLSSLCVLVTILNVFVMIAINSMEFRRNAMQISLENILGYTLYERHKNVIVNTIRTDMIVTICVCLFHMAVSNLSIFVAIMVGIVMMVLELGILLANILMLEKEKVPKTLKGGCL